MEINAQAQTPPPLLSLSRSAFNDPRRQFFCTTSINGVNTNPSPSLCRRFMAPRIDDISAGFCGTAGGSGEYLLFECDLRANVPPIQHLPQPSGQPVVTVRNRPIHEFPRLSAGLRDGRDRRLVEASLHQVPQSHPLRSCSVILVQLGLFPREQLCREHEANSSVFRSMVAACMQSIQTTCTNTLANQTRRITPDPSFRSPRNIPSCAATFTKLSDFLNNPTQDGCEQVTYRRSVSDLERKATECFSSLIEGSCRNAGTRNRGRSPRSAAAPSLR